MDVSKSVDSLVFAHRRFEPMFLNGEYSSFFRLAAGIQKFLTAVETIDVVGAQRQRGGGEVRMIVVRIEDCPLLL